MVKIISPSTHASNSDKNLYGNRKLDFSPIKSTLFPEKTTSSVFNRKAIYHHPDITTEIKYTYRGGSTLPPFTPHSEYGPQCFANRDEILYQESLLRLKGRAHLPVSTRYRGYEDGLIATIKGIVKRTFYIITKCDIQKGLAAYDLHLASQTRTLAFANYSTKSAQNFDIQIYLSSPLKNHLGIHPDDHDYYEKFNYTNTWHKNGLPNYQFIEDGKAVTLHNTIVSSNDRTNDRICMMRRVDSQYTKESVFYTGRCDSKSKAIEQATFIFRNEMKKKSEAGKGLIYNSKTNEYELTYVVNNLMSSSGIGKTGITAISGFNERNSIINEREVLKNLETVNIDGKKVRLKPIYFNQTFNFLNNFAVCTLQKEINAVGYPSLIQLAYEFLGIKDNPLVRKAIQHLESPTDLLPEEEFFYRDLLCKILRLPEVIHCKSSTDRTIIAAAVSMATHQWMNCNQPIPDEHPHQILSYPIFKELFIANVMSGHQVTGHSRSAEGIIKGTKQFSQLLGFAWGSNGHGKNPIALRMIPDRYKREGKRPLNIRVTLFFLKIAKKKFHQKKINKKITYLEKAYKKEEFDHNSFWFKGHCLIKPPKMKIYYTKKDKHPKAHLFKKTSTVKNIKSGLKETAAIIILTLYGFFDAIVSI